MDKAKRALLAALLLVLTGCSPVLQVRAVDIEAREKLNEVIENCCPQGQPTEVVDGDSKAD